MATRKIMDVLAVLAIAALFAVTPASAAPDDKRADPPETKEQNQDHVVGEELC